MQINNQTAQTAESANNQATTSDGAGQRKTGTLDAGRRRFLSGVAVAACGGIIGRVEASSAGAAPPTDSQPTGGHVVQECPRPEISRGASQASLSFIDDFDYPGADLPANGWVIENGAFTTSSSILKRNDNRSDTLRAQIVRNQPSAAGRFEFTVENDARFFGMTIMLIADSTLEYRTDSTLERFRSRANGYRLKIRQKSRGDIVFQRVNEDGSSTTLLNLTEDHGGEQKRIRIERNPETLEFTVWLDGKLIGTITDDTYSTSQQMGIAFDGNSGTQGIDRIVIQGEEVTGSGSPLDPPAAMYDTNGDGQITIQELGRAGLDFANGQLSIVEYGKVAIAYANS